MSDSDSENNSTSDTEEQPTKKQKRDDEPEENKDSLVEYLRNNREFSDIKVITSSKEFQLHKLFLSRCPYFKKILEWEKKDTIDLRETEKSIEGIQSSSFEHYFQFLYTDEMNISEEDIKGVMNLASYISFPYFSLKLKAYILDYHDNYYLEFLSKNDLLVESGIFEIMNILTGRRELDRDSVVNVLKYPFIPVETKLKLIQKYKVEETGIIDKYFMNQLTFSKKKYFFLSEKTKKSIEEVKKENIQNDLTSIIFYKFFEVEFQIEEDKEYKFDMFSVYVATKTWDASYDTWRVFIKNEISFPIQIDYQCKIEMDVGEKREGSGTLQLSKSSHAGLNMDIYTKQCQKYGGKAMIYFKIKALPKDTKINKKKETEDKYYHYDFGSRCDNEEDDEEVDE